MIPHLVIEKIISGGQTGADRAGLDAAILCGVPHGGWCPKGRLAEDGRIPDQYQLTETAGASYLARTERNVKHSDGTVILTLGALSGGSLRTADFARRHHKPCLHLRLEETDHETAVRALSHFTAAHGIKALNIAGSRGNGEPGVYERVFEVVKPSCRIELIMVVPRHITQGAAAWTRLPRGERPRKRIMFVLAEDSSRNTRRDGSSPSWVLHQFLRLRAT